MIGDENFTATECRGGPTGALFMYDITAPQVPVFQSYFGIDRGAPAWTPRSEVTLDPPSLRQAP